MSLLVFQALHYCEVISWRVVAAPAKYSATLVTQVLSLAERLKYHDPERQHASDDAADPTWLQQLQHTAQAVMVSSSVSFPFLSDPHG